MRAFVNHPLTVPVALGLLALVARLVPTPRVIDDAYITFRYARNILAGIGFVYNPGERVLGTTTPLYTLLMAALAFVLRTDNYPWLALGVNAVADAITCALLVTLGERLSGQRRVGIAAGLLWAVAPMSVTFAIGGMETSVFIMLMMATYVMYMSPRPRSITPISASLALLTRPDALLFVGPIVLDFVARSIRRKAPTSDLRPLTSSLLVFLLPLLLWAIFATLYFGSPLPHSIAAKVAAYRLPPDAALVRLIQHYGTPFFDQLVLGRFWPLAGFFVYLLLFVIGSLSFIRRDSRAWPLVAYPILYFAAFSLANPLIFRWYLAPPLPMYFIGIIGGIEKIGGDAASALRKPGVAAWAVRAASAGFMLLSLNAWTLHPDHGPDRPAPQMAWHQLELLYERVGRELAPEVDRQTTIAAGDVGALGYFSGARILDTVGLMSPEATAYYPLPASDYVINYAIPADLILDRRPEYVVILEVYGRNTLLRNPRFAAEYALIEIIPADIYGSEGMLIFHRKDSE
ncbi:MAG: hypothetical protein HY023_12350 [Chloroflexi bacterium]|nr:hypothetical protein [Chloroflexota bacterium]